MKIVLISTDESTAAMGVRTLSSNLIKHGFETAVAVLSTWDEGFSGVRWQDLAEVCSGAGLIGVSCMTHGLAKARQVRSELHRMTNTPVIIGGIHATLDPGSLIDDFEFVCHGEGEDLLTELAASLGSGEDPCSIPGLWGRYRGKEFKNPAQPLKKDINDYPFPDYDLRHQYILQSGRIVPMNESHIVCDYFEVMGSRGCPHACTFCSNAQIKRDFPWRSRVRQYSVDYLIGHLKEVSRAYPAVKSFWLEDDTFLAKSREEVGDFSLRYRREIGKPFCTLISPWTYSQEKMELLVGAGMDRLILGVQSGSENTSANIYGRRITNKKLMEVIASVNAFGAMLPYYDFIGMNPFESADDLISTIKFIRGIPVPFFLFSNNLAFYPGTQIRQRALEQGIDMAGRDRHTDARHGYVILKDTGIGHKIFHLLLLLMGGKANRLKIGLVPRFLIGDTALKFYAVLDRTCGRMTDAAAGMLSALLMRLDWKYFLKKRLNRRQIHLLKKIYHLFFD